MAEDTFADMRADPGLRLVRRARESGPFRWQDAAHDIPGQPVHSASLRPRGADPTSTRNLSSASWTTWRSCLTDFAAQMDLVLADFRKRGARQDPIMHFYGPSWPPTIPPSGSGGACTTRYIVRSVDRLTCGSGSAARRAWRTTGRRATGRRPARSGRRTACGARPRLRHRLVPLAAVVDHVREHYRPAAGRAAATSRTETCCRGCSASSCSWRPTPWRTSSWACSSGDGICRKRTERTGPIGSTPASD